MARFHCEPNSDVPAEVHWGFGNNNGPLPAGVLQSGDDLVIDSADESNAGEYICQATNKFGSGQSNPVKLELVDEPEEPKQSLRVLIVDPKTDTPLGPRIILTAGEPLEIRCDAFGEPDPEVEWLQ